MNFVLALLLAAATLFAVRLAAPNGATANPPLPTPTPATIIIGEPS